MKRRLLVMLIATTVAIAACGKNDGDKSVPTVGIKLDRPSVVLVVGDTVTLKTNIQSDTWTSSNPAVATVNNGTVTAITTGKATITATAGNKTAICALTVEGVGKLAIWSHTEPGQSLDSQYTSLQSLLDGNPYISGVTIKYRWNLLHPTEGVINMDALQKEVDLCASRGIEVELEMMVGYWRPQWVMDKGVDNIGSTTIGSTTKDPTPMVWDPTYKRMLKEDIQKVADRFNNNPAVTTVTITGHNYQTGEMHAPKPTPLMISKGYSQQMVLSEWEEWIDFYAATFPSKKLVLCVTKGYDTEMPEKILDLLLSKYRSRAIMGNCQLDGRQDMALQEVFIDPILSRHPDLPVCFELVGSFLDEPLRQGTAEMTVFNARQGGPVFNLRLWRRDCDDIKYARDLMDAWNKYKPLSMPEFKAELIREGKYLESSDWKNGMPVK